MSEERKNAVSDFLTKALDYARAGGKVERITSKATPDYGDGVMIAFYLPRENWELFAPFSEMPPEELHLTLAYLGTVDEQAVTQEALVQCLAQFARDAQPVWGTVNGVARFYNVEGDGTNAVVALFDSPALPEWRQRLVEHLRWYGDGGKVEVSKKHGFIPHITVRYIDQQALADTDSVVTVPSARLVFYNLHLQWGDKRIPFRLQGMLDETVEAFLAEGETYA